MKIYEFFEGLNESGVQTTLDEYTSGHAKSAGWRVHAMGHNSDGFWMLLERPA